MGVVNVTPDSFSDGGMWSDTDRAVQHGRDLLAEGADLLDVGGESTRPGARRPSTDIELQRVVPVVESLASAGAVVTVDTMRSTVAATALDAGAVAVNDVSGGLADSRMLPLVAEREVPIVLTHWRGPSETMQQRAEYSDVVAEVVAALGRRVDAALASGVRLDRIVVDPGIGFGKTAEHNWALLHGLDRIAALGRPVLVGASRKSFLGALLGSPDRPRDVADREAATTAVTALAAGHGVWCVRTHRVQASVDAALVAHAWRTAGGVLAV